jgi:hypothetical protein
MKLTENDLREKHSETSEVFKETIKQKDRVLEDYRREHGRLEIFFENLKANINPIEPVKITYKPHSKDTTYDVVMQISDTHAGSIQEFDEIEGFNEYNYSICESRNLQYAEKFMEWVIRKRNSYRVDNLSILVTGDLVSGDIHDELRVTNEFPVTVQIIKASELLAKQVTILSPNFKHIKVEFIGADNHGRLTKKPQAKEEGINSYNYLVGYMASLHLQKFSNVEFNIYPVHEKVIHVGSRQYLLSHGHGIRGWMGIPWYSVERKQNKEARARLQIIMEATENELKMMRMVGFHKFVFGHFHYPINTPNYSCCGSTQGTDAYDHQNGRHADPSQSAWIIHPLLGEFDRIDFNLK